MSEVPPGPPDRNAHIYDPAEHFSDPVEHTFQHGEPQPNSSLKKFCVAAAQRASARALYATPGTAGPVSCIKPCIAPSYTISCQSARADAFAEITSREFARAVRPQVKSRPLNVL